jgi:RimJ/RimL family protein N-acetyltransferase
MLRGPRVVLRPFERDDVKRLHELFGNVELVLAGGADWAPWPLAAMERDFDKELERAGAEQCEFAIEIEGACVGVVGLHRDRINRRSNSAEFGIGIYDPAYVGRGYGREALGLFLDWCFRIQNFRRIGLITWSTNERAIRCYRACGFAEEAREREAQYTDGRYVDVVRMGLLRDEWEAARAR